VRVTYLRSLPDNAAASAGDPYVPLLGNGGYHVVSYDLQLHCRVATNRLEASATIVAVSSERLRSFSLDFAQLRASRVTVNGSAGTRFSQSANKLKVTPDDPVSAGDEFTVIVDYAGSPKPRSSPIGPVGWNAEPSGLGTTGEPFGASTWFPCNDHPSDKSRYRIRVSTEQDFRVVCSGILVEHTVDAGRGTWLYEQTAPTPACLVSVQIGGFASIRLVAGGLPVVLAYPNPTEASVRHDFRSVGRMLDFFRQRFGPYPFESLAIVVTDAERISPVIAQSLVVFGSNHVDGRAGHVQLVAEGIARQWFGGSVGLAVWRDVWLAQGLACYAGWLWSERSGRASADDWARHVHSQVALLPADLRIGEPGRSRIADSRIRARGALTMHALRLTIGDLRFASLVTAWCQAHRYGVASTEDFRRLAAEHAHESLDPFFDAWLLGEDLPALP
jgi:aminopeptidase N